MRKKMHLKVKLKSKKRRRNTLKNLREIKKFGTIDSRIDMEKYSL